MKAAFPPCGSSIWRYRADAAKRQKLIVANILELDGRPLLATEIACRPRLRASS